MDSAGVLKKGGVRGIGRAALYCIEQNLAVIDYVLYALVSCFFPIFADLLTDSLVTNG